MDEDDPFFWNAVRPWGGPVECFNNSASWCANRTVDGSELPKGSFGCLKFRSEGGGEVEVCSCEAFFYGEGCSQTFGPETGIYTACFSFLCVLVCTLLVVYTHRLFRTYTKLRSGAPVCYYIDYGIAVLLIIACCIVVYLATTALFYANPSSGLRIAVSAAHAATIFSVVLISAFFGFITEKIVAVSTNSVVIPPRAKCFLICITLSSLINSRISSGISRYMSYLIIIATSFLTYLYVFFKAAALLEDIYGTFLEKAGESEVSLKLKDRLKKMRAFARSVSAVPVALTFNLFINWHFDCHVNRVGPLLTFLSLVLAEVIPSAIFTVAYFLCFRFLIKTHPGVAVKRSINSLSPDESTKRAPKVQSLSHSSSATKVVPV